MKPTQKSLASYKRTPKLGKGDKLTYKKRQSNILGVLSTPGGLKNITKSPMKKPSLKIIRSSKTRGGTSNRPRGLKIWKVTDIHTWVPPANYQYMNPASYGHAINDADSTISYSSSENWYKHKRRAKNSKSSNRSSAHANSVQHDGTDEGFLKDLLHKNEDLENQNINNLMSLITNKRVENSISKFSSHLNLPDANYLDEVPENNIMVPEEDSRRVSSNPQSRPESSSKPLEGKGECTIRGFDTFCFVRNHSILTPI